MIIEIFETDYSSSCFLLNEIQIVILTLRCPKDENRRRSEILITVCQGVIPNEHQNRITNKCQRLTVNVLSLKQEILRIASNPCGSLFKLGWSATPFFSA